MSRKKKIKQNVLICIPSIRAEVKLFTALSLCSTAVELARLGINADIVSWVGDSILPSARNVLFGKFYDDPDKTDLVFIDDDIAWQVGALPRLLSHPVDMVGASYRVKSDEERFTLRTLPGKHHVTDPKTGLLEVAGMPTGFLRFTKKAAEQLVTAYPERKYKPHFAGAKETWCMFEWPFRPEGLWGEDFGFCERYRSAGGKVWCDPHIAITHVGVKEYGPMSLHEHFWKQGAVRETPDPNVVEALKKELDGDKLQKLFKVALGEAA